MVLIALQNPKVEYRNILVFKAFSAFILMINSLIQHIDALFVFAVIK